MRCVRVIPFRLINTLDTNSTIYLCAMDNRCRRRCHTRIDCFSNCVRQSRYQHQTCRRCMHAVRRTLSARSHWWMDCRGIAFVHLTDDRSPRRSLDDDAHIVPTIYDFAPFESVEWANEMESFGCLSNERWIKLSCGTYSNNVISIEITTGLTIVTMFTNRCLHLLFDSKEFFVIGQ